jgi:hypothetical protein
MSLRFLCTPPNLRHQHQSRPLKAIIMTISQSPFLGPPQRPTLCPLFPSFRWRRIISQTGNRLHPRLCRRGLSISQSLSLLLPLFHPLDRRLQKDHVSRGMANVDRSRTDQVILPQLVGPSYRICLPSLFIFPLLLCLEGSI